jgi:hypothetical protein
MFLGGENTRQGSIVALPVRFVAWRLRAAVEIDSILYEYCFVSFYGETCLMRRSECLAFR